MPSTLNKPLVAVDELDEKTPAPSDLVFPSPRGEVISPTNFIRRAWRPALEAAGVDYRSPVHMRHSYASLALDAGATMEEIASQLSQTSTQITYKHYAQFRKPAHDRLLDKLDALAMKSLAEADEKGTETKKADVAL